MVLKKGHWNDQEGKGASVGSHILKKKQKTNSIMQQEMRRDSIKDWKT